MTSTSTAATATPSSATKTVSVVMDDAQSLSNSTTGKVEATDEIIIGNGKIAHASSVPSNVVAAADARFTFPRDFPKAAPGGITVITFSAFKERGICVTPRADDPEELEVDGLGIPTIAMKVLHKTDKCKTKTRRTKRKEDRQKEAKVKYLDRGLPIPFWEEWEENESLRIAKPTNASDSRMMKFVGAAVDFRTGRKWPLQTNSQIDPSHLWTVLKVFMGIEGIAKKKDRPSRKKVFSKPFSDEDDDDDSDMDVDPYVDEDSDDGLSPGADAKDRKAFQFMNDPEKMIRIFLSSYVRAKGIIWSKINLEQTPRLCKFFLEFLIRSRTLPRSETSLRAAVEVAKQAIIELPLTSALSSIMPDEFSKGCRECFGAQTEMFRTLEKDEEWLEKLRANDEAVIAKAKRLEAAEANADSEERSAIAASEEGDRDGEQSKTIEGGVAGTKVTDMDDVNGGWGLNAGSEQDASGWGPPVEVADEGWGGVGGITWTSEELDQAAEEDFGNAWTVADDEKSCILQLLGPTVFPLTHTTGIVEQSLRRITELIPIPTNVPPKTVVSEDDAYVPDPAGVEFELERRFPKVVLSPWLNWDGGEMPAYSEPRILNTSRGPTCEPPYVANDEVQAASTVATTPKPHDPANDSITVIVHPSVFEKLVKGMCFAGTWVQIVRQAAEPGSAAPPKKKKKGGKKKGIVNYWYLDDLAGVFPSYWTAK